MFDSGGPTCMDGMRSKIPHCSRAGAPYVKTVIRVVIEGVKLHKLLMDKILTLDIVSHLLNNYRTWDGSGPNRFYSLSP